MTRRLSVLLAALLLAGCTVESVPTVRPTSTAGQTSPAPSGGPVSPSTQAGSPSASAGSAPVHVIGVGDAADGGRELVDTSTGQPFRARGVNLLRKGLIDGRIYDTLFGSTYDRSWVDGELGRLAELGYNTVRVFLD